LTSIPDKEKSFTFNLRIFEFFEFWIFIKIILLKSLLLS
jgi:hypothetical protein